MKNRLKELRSRDGLNQTELAKRARISRQTVSLIERNEYMPSLLIAVRIANVFQEPIEKVFLFSEEELS
ncbi:helix-turn-helix transcriptional regulator [Salirhabdus sp. Marseille-P4669]|uniref:helix-turn-helix transcriptional regulator n=1 Tax=Salirhabdus sp. Marseille-P4669 TaxID=2042310 RepID=UPI000C7B89A1|nr:helix-turn-helix transcriptional regulator [Salirhabdus sp. Marseille-P4669]